MGKYYLNIMCLDRILTKMYGVLPKGNREDSYGFTEDAMQINLTELLLVYESDEFSKNHNSGLRFCVKMVGFLMCTTNIIFCVLFFPPLDLIAFLTNWTIMTTWL